MRAFLVIMLAMFCVSCSKADVNKTSADLKAAGTQIKDAPALKQLGTDIKVDARHTGAELKVAGAKAKDQLAQAGDKAKHSLKDAGDKAKDKTDEATHHHDSDDNGHSDNNG
jgi:hypothetical protein